MEHTWKCDCGSTVQSWGGNDTECANCHQQYNGFGQRLRDNWQGNPSNYDDEIGDMEGYELQYAYDE